MAAAVALMCVAATHAAASEFDEKLARVDEGLRTNPAGVPQPVLEACKNRRNFAVRQARARQTARAERSLRFCFDVMMVPEKGPMPGETPAEQGPTEDEMRAMAVAEIEKALALEPDLARGRDIYRDCAMCHEPEGWGLVAGTTPQIAGQHRTVLIKQLADMRAGHRDAVVMLPYASVEAIGGPQAVADVTGYIDSLEMTTSGGKGDGKDLELGAQLYARNCQRCHGASGEGDAERFMPRIQAQHYKYLLRQFEAIRTGKRRNADPEMTQQIENFSERETEAVLDYVSRLEPPAELLASPGWYNPDFPRRSQPPR
jgi:cytochrome c553